MGNLFDDVNYATLEDHRHTLRDEILNETDVLIWWGHLAHDKVDDVVVEKFINEYFKEWD